MKGGAMRGRGAVSAEAGAHDAGRADASAGRTLSGRIAAYWSGARFEDLPEEVVRKAKGFILDTIAAGTAGGDSDVVNTVAAGAAAASGGGRVPLWGRGDRAAPAAAALVNGTAAHALELDDFGGCGHSGAVVVPAVWALALGAPGRGSEGAGGGGSSTGTGTGRGAGAATPVSGRDFILAVVAGYDLASRLLDGAGGYRPHNERGWHSTGTCGSFGAAAGAARLLNLPEDRFAHALGIAGTYTGGTWAFLADGALVKRFHPGKAAETGVSAALLAQAGLTGPGQILEAEWGGFFNTYAKGDATPERAVAGLGTDFHLLRSGIKPHACCRTLHSAVDAALQIMRERGAGSGAIRKMIVHGNAQTQRQFSRTDIHNLLEAQFSAPYCLAVATQSGRATLDQFQPLRTADAEIQRLMALTEIHADRVLTPADYPSLEIVFADGSQRTLDIPHARGAPENPLTEAEIVQKARTLLDPVVGADSARAFIAAVLDLDHAPDFAAVAALLQPGSRT
jgi:2-methylcitrate dehydratase PrpD